jgi:hypothetical protein
MRAQGSALIHSNTQETACYEGLRNLKAIVNQLSRCQPRCFPCQVRGMTSHQCAISLQPAEVLLLKFLLLALLSIQRNSNGVEASCQMQGLFICRQTGKECSVGRCRLLLFIMTSSPEPYSTGDSSTSRFHSASLGSTSIISPVFLILVGCAAEFPMTLTAAGTLRKL